MAKSRGHKTSERKAAYHAVFIGCIMGIAGIVYDADLTGLGILIGIVVSPISFLYPASRTIVKFKHGEKKND